MSAGVIIKHFILHPIIIFLKDLYDCFFYSIYFNYYIIK